jgi:hypothetical protein
MALIKCKECGIEVSSKAETCPKCGVRIAVKPMVYVMFIAGIVVGIIILSVIFMFFYSDKLNNLSSKSTSHSSISESESVLTPTPELPAPQPAPEPEAAPVPEAAPALAQPSPELPGSQWNYYKDNDEMSKGYIYRAEVLSSNTVDFKFPYSGEQHAALVLWTHPRAGKYIVLVLIKGQILCTSYEECTVLVRFDDEKSVKYSAIGPADNNNNQVFIYNYSRFVEKMLKAKRVRISVNIYQEGSPVFEFDVSGFDQSKYKPKK